MTTPIQLYVFLPSQNAVRPQIALNEKGLSFERISVELLKGEHRRPPLSELTPRGQVPTLVYGDGAERVVVYESIAILQFLEDLHPEPALVPPLEDRRARAAMYMRIAEFFAKLDGKNVFGSVVFRKMNREQLGQRADDIVTEVAHWGRYAQGHDYLVGDLFTLADIAVFPLLMHFEVLGFDFAKHAPALDAYLKRCQARESIRRTGWVETLRSFVASMDAAMELAEL